MAEAKPPQKSVTPKSFESSQLMPKRSVHDDAHFDVTPMVDLVFMMNIYFLVSWLTAAMAEVDLPAAQHCSATNLDEAVVVTIKFEENHRLAYYVGDVRPEAEVKPADIEQRLTSEVSQSYHQINSVLIKAERNVQLRDVVRVATAAAAAVKGSKLNLAVLEKN
jgi:biopolymer transport protein ExbD